MGWTTPGPSRTDYVIAAGITPLVHSGAREQESSEDNKNIALVTVAFRLEDESKLIHETRALEVKNLRPLHDGQASIETEQGSDAMQISPKSTGQKA